jgi:trans-aconitate 2-methyltransferase
LDSWNAKIYSQFLNLRTRPARDLLSAIPNTFKPKIAYDLGCGPGNSTILLKDRWPNAKIIGLDSSLDMLAKAKTSFPNITFIEGHIEDFWPKEKADCLFANASLQWVNHHEILIPKLIKFINPNGVLAIQMPNNFHSPSHQVTVKILKNDKDLEHLLRSLPYGELKEPLYKLSWYYDLLIKSGANSLQLWETEYFQEMPSYQEIFDWVKGTSLRPVLSSMNDENKLRFTKAYIKALSSEYPLQKNQKILFPFRRIFIIGFK